MERYSINPARFPLEHFYELTSSRQLLPDRRILLEKIVERFKILRKQGITNLQDLITTLRTKEKILKFAQESGIPEAYLIRLKREAGSYISRPLRLSEIPGIPYEYLLMLESRGIKNTKQFFESVRTKEQQHNLSGLSGIPEARLQEIYCLSDLSRINGVGGVFARTLYMAGIRSIQQFAQMDTRQSINEYMKMLAEMGYSSVRIVERDLEYCINYASVLLQFSKL